MSIRVLRAIGFVSLVVLLVWIIYVFRHGEIFRATPRLLGLGSAFEFPTHPGVSESEITTAYDKAMAAMHSHNRIGSVYSLWYHIVDWIGFALTATITLIAGYFGQLPKSGQNQVGVTPELLAGVGKEARQAGEEPKPGSAAVHGRRSPNWVTFLGVLAAAASLCTGLSSRLQTAAQAEFKRSDALLGELKTARQLFLNKNSPADQIASEIDQLGTVAER